MGFVRFRHDALGDIGRLERQQIFLNALIAKITSPAGWLHIPRMIGIVHKSILTDMSDRDILQSLTMLRHIPRQNLQITVLPGHFSGSGAWDADASALSSVMTEFNN